MQELHGAHGVLGVVAEHATAGAPAPGGDSRPLSRVQVARRRPLARGGCCGAGGVGARGPRVETYRNYVWRTARGQCGAEGLDRLDVRAGRW